MEVRNNSIKGVGIDVLFVSTQKCDFITLMDATVCVECLLNLAANLKLIKLRNINHSAQRQKKKPHLAQRIEKSLKQNTKKAHI